MKKTSLVLVPLLIVIITILLRLNTLQNRIPVNQVTPTSTKSLSLNDLYLLAQKNQALKQISDSQVYYSALKTEISPNRFRIDIFLSGKDNMKVDAADLTLIANPTLTIANLKKGSVFPQYPRLIVNNNQIIITGLASLSGNTIKLGELNQVFASFEVYKNSSAKEPTIVVDQNSTKAFLNGESVLNQSVSLSKIEL